MNKDYRATVLSLGAGVQSSALLLACERGDLPFKPDFAVFADTKNEPDDVYHWLNFLETITSIPIIRISKGNLAEDMLAKGSRFASIPFFMANSDGELGLLRRQCTKEYKLEPVIKAIRFRLGVEYRKRMKGRVRVLIGISRDEAHRMKPSRTPWIDNTYPLVDAGWRRETCKAYVIKETNRTPPRSACFMCPYHNDYEWANMQKNQPEAFDQAIEFDRRIRSGPKIGQIKGVPFIHRSLQPLGEIDFTSPKEQVDFFGNECEGICGV